MNPFQEVWQAFMKNQPQGANHDALGVTPPMSVKEYNKKIGELETVENWMKINLQMLQMSIQTLKQQKSMMEMFEGVLHVPNAQPVAAKTANPMHAPMNSMLEQWGEWVRQHPLTTINPIKPQATKPASQPKPTKARNKKATPAKPKVAQPRG